jgi:hypothetical protein
VTRAAITHRSGVALCLLSIVLSAGACTSADPPSQPTSSITGGSQPSTSADPKAVGKDAQEILDHVFISRKLLGGGYGALQPDLSNTLAGTSEHVLSVTFAFVCTGNATTTLKVAVNYQDVPSAAGIQACDGTVYQKSVETLKPSPVSFTASIAGQASGSFAYSYYAEKQQ